MSPYNFPLRRLIHDYLMETGVCVFVCVWCVCVCVCAHGRVSTLTKSFTKITPPPFPQKHLIYFTCSPVNSTFGRRKFHETFTLWGTHRCTPNKNDEIQVYNVLITDVNYANER